MARYFWLGMFLIWPLSVFAQKKADKKLLENLQQHVTRLSDDTTASGTEAYITDQFQAAGLTPVLKSYRQAVISNAGKSYSPGTFLYLNDTLLAAGNDFVPLPFSAQDSVDGSPLIAVQEQNEPWIIDLASSFDAQPPYPDSLVVKTIYALTKQAQSDHAKAILFYSSNDSIQLPPDLPATGPDSLSIPVVFINPPAAKKYFGDPTASVNIKLQVRFTEKHDTAYNIIGLINNGAPHTLIIGAHDAGDKAALIELGRALQQDKRLSQENYVLVAFAGERNGMTGEQYFLKYPAIDFKPVNGFFNLLHAGNLDPQNPSLYIGGQESPEWKSIFDKAASKDIRIQEDSVAGSRLAATSFPVFSLSGPGESGSNANNELPVIKYLLAVIKEINRTAK